MDDLDVIWNEAVDHGADGEAPEGTPPGIEQLAALLRVYNSAMGGGLGFALEVNEPFRVRHAINAMRYFALVEAADFYDLVDDGTDPVRRAFKATAAEVPADFGRG